MTDLITLHPEAGSASALPQSLQAFQKSQLEKLEGMGIPTRKDEHWKYSSKPLRNLEGLLPDSTIETFASSQAAYSLDAYQLRLGNGALCSADSLPAGVSLKAFSELSEEEAKRVVEGLIAQSNELPFATLNHAAIQEGIFLTIEAKVRVDKPIQLLIQQSQTGSSNSHVYVLVGEQAEATLIEDIQYYGSDDNAAMINHVTDIEIQNNAKLRYVRMDLAPQAGLKVIAATGAKLQRDARFESHCLGLGSNLSRHDLKVQMLAPGSECKLNGVCVTKDKQVYDNHTVIDHVAPHCQSEENYRCIADDESQIVFNGRIHIYRDAQKTLGAMSNKNLLLSSQAEIDAKPELEIYADDVKCAHGTTIGQLDEQEIYYLKTRGIQDEQARQMLTLGFVLEVVHENPITEIAEYWEALLADQLRFDA